MITNLEICESWAGFRRAFRMASKILAPGDTIRVAKCPGRKRTVVFDGWDSRWIVSKSGIRDFAPSCVDRLNGEPVDFTTMEDEEDGIFLEGFKFADAQSRRHALLAREWVSLAQEWPGSRPFRPPLVIVRGKVHSGKSTLVQRMGITKCFNGHNVETVLNFCAKEGATTVCFDDACGLFGRDASRRARSNAMALESFVTATDWSWRRVGREKMELAVLRTVVVLMWRLDVEIPQDLLTRAVIIDLKQLPWA